MPLGAFRLNSLARFVAASGPTFTPYSDPNAGYLELAMPFNEVTGFEDIAYQISGTPNSTATPVTDPSNPSHAFITTSDSQFYGSSYTQVAGGGSSNKLIYSLQNTFNLSGVFTFEFWLKTTRDNAAANSWFLSNGDINGFRMLVGFDLGFSTSPGSISLGETRVNVVSGWHHIVIQDNYWWFDGNRINIVYPVNGVLEDLYLGHQKNGDSNDWEGFMNDFRLYVGLRKYGSMSSFTPPGAMGTIS